MQRQSLNKLLSRLPEDVASSFTEEQKTALDAALFPVKTIKKSVDSRGTFYIPFYKWRFFYVIMLGKDRRVLSPQEQHIALTTTLLFTTLFALVLIGFIFVLVYLLKSFLGIDLFSDFSLGIWDWFRQWLE